MDILFYSVFSRCPCLVNGRISPVKISLTPAISSPSSSFSSLYLVCQGLALLIMSPNRPDLANNFLYFGCYICFFFCYNHLINFLSSLFISLANLDSYVASATARSSPTSSYLFSASLFFFGYYYHQLHFILLPRFVYYFVFFLHGVYFVPLLYYYVVNENRLFNFLCAIRLLYDHKHSVIFTLNATDQSASSQTTRDYNVDLTHAHSNRNYRALVKIRIVLTIRTRFGVSLESHSSQHPVSLIPAASDQSDSNRRAPNCNGNLLSNQLDSTQSPGLSKLQVDAVSISNSSELQGNEDLTGVNKIASSSSELQTNQLAPPDWGALDHGLISEIAHRLPTDEDFVSFKEVCRWWRFLCAGMNWTTNRQLPWLMLSERVHSNMRSFYSFDKNRHYEIELRAARQSRCFASPHGWIVTLTPHGKICILNPLSQDLKMLPLLRASINQRFVGDWFQYIHKLMVFKSSPNEFLVMAIYGSRNLLAFVRFGEQKWNTVKDASEIRDVALFGGQFYALRAFGTLVCIEFRGVARAIFIAPPPQDSRIPAEVYLVKSSSGDLLGIFRFGIELERRRETENFLVYKFDFVTEEWESLEDLGECAVFVGEGNSWCIRATNAEHGNRVYYTDDYWKQRAGEVTPNGHDIGVFSMESGETEFLNFGTDFPSEFSRPIWITPNSRAKFFPY